MGLETSTTIAGLNALWPLGSDSKSQGDDHLRLIKSVLKAEFPGTGSAAFAKATAQTRSRIVNGAMQISQEYGNSPGSGTGFYIVDQWIMNYVGTVAVTQQRVQVVTPNGSVNRWRVTINTADAALAAGDALNIVQPIEGIRIADFRWGSASAKQVILRFGWKSPAGTYTVGLMNGGQTRTYLANFTITAGQTNTDTEQTLIIPGDVTGTWAVDNGAGVVLRFGIAGGTTFQGTVGWQAGGLFATAATSNGMATAGNVFELFDVGLYLDPDATGVPPKWTMPDEAEELAACQRYYNKYAYLQLWSGYTAAGGLTFGNIYITPMRTSPAVTFSGVSYNNSSAIASYVSNPAFQVVSIVTTTAATCSAAFTAAFNARM